MWRFNAAPCPTTSAFGCGTVIDKNLETQIKPYRSLGRVTVLGRFKQWQSIAVRSKRILCREAVATERSIAPTGTMWQVLEKPIKMSEAITIIDDNINFCFSGGDFSFLRPSLLLSHGTVVKQNRNKKEILSNATATWIAVTQKSNGKINGHR